MVAANLAASYGFGGLLMMLKWLPSSRTPSRITSDLDVKKTELDFNPYLYYLLVQLNCRRPQTWHLLCHHRREIRSKEMCVCAVILFLIHQHLLTYVLEVLHGYKKQRSHLSPFRMPHMVIATMKAALGCLHTVCHTDIPLECVAGLQKAWSSQSCCMTSLSIPRWNISPWGVPSERLCTLPVLHCACGLEWPQWSWALFCEAHTMSKCYGTASYWEQRALPNICLQFTGLLTPDGVGMRQTASWLHWNIPL